MLYDVILSGPVQGHEDYVVRFAQAVVRVRQKWHGCAVWNPAVLEPGRKYEWYMRQCVRAIMDETKPGCVLVLLRGWHLSLGAVAEWALARCLGMPVLKLWEI